MKKQFMLDISDTAVIVDACTKDLHALLLVSLLISLFYNIITVYLLTAGLIRLHVILNSIKWLMASLTLHKTQLVRL